MEEKGHRRRGHAGLAGSRHPGPAGDRFGAPDRAHVGPPQQAPVVHGAARDLEAARHVEPPLAVGQHLGRRRGLGGAVGVVAGAIAVAILLGHRQHGWGHGVTLPRQPAVGRVDAVPGPGAVADQHARVGQRHDRRHRGKLRVERPLEGQRPQRALARRGAGGRRRRRGGEQLAGVLQGDRKPVGKGDPRLGRPRRVVKLHGHPLQLLDRLVAGLGPPQPAQQVRPGPGDPEPLLVVAGDPLDRVDHRQRVGQRGLLPVGNQPGDRAPVGIGQVLFQEPVGLVRERHFVHARQQTPQHTRQLRLVAGGGQVGDPLDPGRPLGRVEHGEALEDGQDLLLVAGVLAVEVLQPGQQRRVLDLVDVDALQQRHGQVRALGRDVEQGQPGVALVGILRRVLGQRLQLLLDGRAGLPGGGRHQLVPLQDGDQLAANAHAGLRRQVPFQPAAEHGGDLPVAPAARGDFREGHPPLQTLAGPGAGVLVQLDLLRAQEGLGGLEALVEGDGRFEPQAVAGDRVGQLAGLLDQLPAGPLVAQAPVDRQQQHPDFEVGLLLLDPPVEGGTGLDEELLLDHELDQVHQLFQLGLLGDAAGQQRADLLAPAQHQVALGQLAPHVEGQGVGPGHLAQQLGRVARQGRAPQEPRHGQQGGRAVGRDRVLD